MPDWAKLRVEFPALANFVYLDTASFGQLPRAASVAISNHLQHRDETASSQFLGWFDDMDRIREGCARLINSDASDIAFVPNACTGLGWLMQGLEWKPGDEILTFSNEFPNQLYQGPTADRFGAVFRSVMWPDFYSSVNARTRLVLLSEVNYASGIRVPLQEISDFLRARDVLLYIDGTQSVGALQFDAKAVRPAMLCVDAYKWMLSPNGAGFAYVDEEVRTRVAPSTVGWRSDSGWRAVAGLNHGRPVFSESAQRYEGGMLPFPSLYAMGEVLELMLAIGPAAIEERVLELAGKTRSMLSGLGCEVNSDASQIVTALLPGRDVNAIALALKAQRILISARHGRLRVSTHFYNNEDDIEALGHALR